MNFISYPIGFKRKYLGFIRFHFLDWADTATKAKYHNSVGYLFDEMWDGRVEPKYDISIIHEMKHEGNDVPEDGPAEEGIIEVVYDNRKITPEKIESLLTAVGLRIKRADPFFFTPNPWKRVTGILLAPILIPLALVLWFIVWLAERRAAKNSR